MYGGVVRASPRTRTRGDHWHYVSLPGDWGSDQVTKYNTRVISWHPPSHQSCQLAESTPGCGGWVTPLVITGIILTATCYRSQTAATGAASVRYADKRVGGDCGEGAVRHWYMCQQPPEAWGDTGVINNELPFKSRRTTDVQFEETHCKLNI